jgi:hypothetical protein
MEGRRKEVLLLVLALAALGLALYTFRGKPAPTGPPAVAEPGAPAEPAPSEGLKVVHIGQGQEGPAQAAAGSEAADAQRNPFSAPGSAPVGPAPDSTPADLPDTPEWGDGSLTLTGVVEGKPDVAILRQGDQRFFVKVGDPIGDGYRVQSIGNHQVVLAGPQGKVILRMGGRQ